MKFCVSREVTCTIIQTEKIAFKVKIVKILNILGIKRQICVSNMKKLSQLKDIDEFYQVKLIETAKIGDK